MAFIIEHIDDLLEIVAAAVALASLVAALTPSETDNKILAKIRKVVDVIALNVANAKPEKK